jgi:hypothetical protein
MRRAVQEANLFDALLLSFPSRIPVFVLDPASPDLDWWTSMIVKISFQPVKLHMLSLFCFLFRKPFDVIVDVYVHKNL